ncbi:MAG: hypothetical protein K6C40_04130, partial [Thermoguttaceae bacterium]|nr:hypothetical protein [Thermoguttaceae bacterium]
RYFPPFVKGVVFVFLKKFKLFNIQTCHAGLFAFLKSCLSSPDSSDCGINRPFSREQLLDECPSDFLFARGWLRFDPSDGIFGFRGGKTHFETSDRGIPACRAGRGSASHV